MNRSSRVAFAVCLFGSGLAARGIAQSTIRVDVASNGVQTVSSLSGSFFPVISGDGRFVAFNSEASNLVPNDITGVSDVFVHDLITGATERVSVDSSGVEGNAGSTNPSISMDGRFVSFQSNANNLVAGDANGQLDIFVRDRLSGTTQLVSVSTGGTQSDGYSASAHISGNGQFVAFASLGTNLVAGDTNGNYDVFVRDLVAGTTERVSVSTAGAQATGGLSANCAISNDGRFVAFSSAATNLVTGDTNAKTDIFLRDRVSNTTTRVSTSSTLAQANNLSDFPSISGDGAFIAYTSLATNLVTGDTNAAADIFRRDRVTNAVVRCSLTSGGVQGNMSSGNSSLSLDGRYVTFDSFATNLVTGDTNTNIDAFRRDVQTGTTTRVSVSTAGNQSNSLAYCSGNGNLISFDGRYVAFYSDSNNLVAGDTNGVNDVFVRDTSAVAIPPVVTYCTAKVNSAGCTPAITSAGLASLSGASEFFVSASNVINQKNGLFFWGLSPVAAPFYGGTLCVNPPTIRTLVQNSGGSLAGNDCTGAYSFDFSASYMTANSLTLGTDVYGQFWSRDPASPGTVGLTDGIHFGICP